MVYICQGLMSWVHGVSLNQLYVIDAYMRHTTFRLWCLFGQCPWDLGSVPAERVGQGEVGGFQHRAQVTWLLLGIAIEALGQHWVGHFSPPLHKWA